MKQYLAWEKLQNKETVEILFGGGAGGGKSLIGCFWLIQMCLQYPGTRWLMGRSVLQNLKKSTLLTLFDVANMLKLKSGTDFKYNGQNNVITFFNGSTIYLHDLAHYPGDPNYDRIGSTEYTGAFIDEVNQITFKAKDVVRSRLRYKLDTFKLTPKLFMSCNPAKNWTYGEFYKPWRENRLQPDRAFIQALAKDNKHNAASYLKSLENLKDRTLKERLWFGNWEYEDTENSLFLIDDIHDLFTNTVEDSDDLFITCDVARMGRDLTVIMVWKGLKCFHIESYAKTSIPDTNKFLNKAQERFKVKKSHTIVDEDGVGGGVVDINGCKGFVGGSSAIQDKQRERDSEYKVNYQNLRAQCFNTLSDLVKKGDIRIQTEDSDIKEKIIEELEQIKAKDVDKDGKIKVIGKDVIKEHLGRSPDFADSLMMRMYYEIEKPAELNIQFI